MSPLSWSLIGILHLQISKIIWVVWLTYIHVDLGLVQPTNDITWFWEVVWCTVLKSCFFSVTVDIRFDYIAFCPEFGLTYWIMFFNLFLNWLTRFKRFLCIGVVIIRFNTIFVLFKCFFHIDQLIESFLLFTKGLIQTIIQGTLLGGWTVLWILLVLFESFLFFFGFRKLTFW